MTAARHTQVKEVFAAACLEPPSERLAFLARHCGEDLEMRREVESLLAFYEDVEPTPATRARSRRAAAPPSRYRRGQVLAGRYRIERLVGAGGMGEVYAVYDGLLRETVALKILHQADALVHRRLVEEVRLARQVTHPAVCRVYDIGDHAGTPFLTMELIDGEDLARRLERSGPLPSAEVIDIAQRLAGALAAAHDAGVLHRDLKPSNILVARKGGLYITDFGIATSWGRKPERAHGDEGGTFGTPAYMAPEETGSGGVITERSDLYSLGLILYELATGALAFDAPDLDTLLAMQRSSAPDPPSRLVPDVDPALEALILQLLAKDPTKRPSSARAVLAALAGEPAAPIDTSPAPRTTERRQIVALVCGVEAPPSLMADRDWPALERIFQARATASCRLRGGRVHRHFAGGLIVHFGVPASSEREGESAVGAGLEIVADLLQRPLVAPERGLVTVSVTVDAVSARVRGSHVITSERPLEPAASEGTVDRARHREPNAVTVGASLLPLLRGAFHVETVDGGDGERRFRVTGAREGLGLEAGAARLTPLVNRQLDLAHLERWWRDAGEGRGQTVLLTGEAGIGKSRTIHELWQRVGPEGVGLEARCSSFDPATPLLPFVRMIAHAAGLDGTDEADARMAKLRQVLSALGPRVDDVLAVFSAWVAPPAAATVLGTGPTEADQGSFIAAAEEWILALTETRPVLLVVEDVQWSDPTSREAIHRLIELARTARVLLVVTFRSSFTPPWKGTSVNHLVLQPLAPNEAHALIEAMPRGAGAETASIVDRADGNPLFLEELALHEQEAGARSHFEVPLSLRGLLAARLDRLGSAKRIAQAAAVCGRTFGYPLLEAIAGTENGAPSLEAGLARLLDAEILFQRGPLPRATFTWKHALVCEAAYESLPSSARRRLHALAARALPALDPATVASRPELVARHWTEAGRKDEAFPWLRDAGLLALQRAAYVEAIQDFQLALRALPKAVPPDQRLAQELKLRLALTTAEMNRSGPASPAARRNARRAEALCAAVELNDDAIHALFLCARARFVGGEIRATRRLVGKLAEVVDRVQDPALRAAILTQACLLRVCSAKLQEAEPLHERASEMFTIAENRPGTSVSGDPLVVNFHFAKSLLDWLRGRRSASRQAFDSATSRIERLGHPALRAMSSVYYAGLALLWDDRPLFARLIQEGGRLAAVLHSDWLSEMAAVFEPLADPSCAPRERAERIRGALDCNQRTRLFRSAVLAELAGILADTDREEDALDTMEEAIDECSRHTDYFLLPEIKRRQGELLVRLGRAAEGETALRRGLRAARAHDAFGLELRCSLSLSRQLAAEERYDAARGGLRSVLSRLPNDVDAPERAEAEHLLRELHG